jgi:peptide/nickel transport system substrate-binding protein
MLAWHDITPALMAEENGELALSTVKATEKKIEWTSLLAGPTLDIQAKYLDQAIKDKYVPYAPTMSQYVKPEEAVARYENLKKWYEAKHHFVIGTGPYYVDQVFPVEKTITVSRYENYLFPADQFANFGEPKIATASVEGPTSVKAGEEATFDVAVNFNEDPYPTADVEKIAYMVFNANNEVVATGEAKNVSDGQYQIVLSKEDTAKLDAASKLSVAVSSKVVSIPAFATAEFVATK